MHYLWLKTTTTDNGICFYDIYTTPELAKASLDGEVDPDLWWEDCSGTWRHYSKEPGSYSYEISEERFYVEW